MKPNTSNLPLLDINQVLLLCDIITLPEVFLPHVSSGFFGLWDPFLPLGGGMAIVGPDPCSNKSSSSGLTRTVSYELSLPPWGRLCRGRRGVDATICCCCCVWGRAGPPFLNLEFTQSFPALDPYKCRGWFFPCQNSLFALIKSGYGGLARRASCQVTCLVAWCHIIPCRIGGWRSLLVYWNFPPSSEESFEVSLLLVS